MKYFLKIIYVIEFLLYYLLKLVQSNIFIAYDILTPRMRASPGFIEYPLSIQSPLGQLLFSNLVSMTPGTLSIDIDKETLIMQVHVLYTNQNDNIVKELTTMHCRIKRLTK